jgi:hypothetical protein
MQKENCPEPKSFSADGSKSSKRKKIETARDIYDKEIDSKRQKMIKKEEYRQILDTSKSF